MMQKSAWAEVSAKAVEHNIRTVKESLSKAPRFCAVVKADAYGHGLTGFARMLEERHLADMLAVGKLSELCKLMKADLPEDLQVLLLGTVPADEILAGISSGAINLERAIFSVYGKEQMQELHTAAKQKGITVKVHIRIDVWDSGMGMGPEEFLTFQKELFSLENLQICGVYSHLYTSYSEDKEVIKEELEKFASLERGILPEYRKQLTVHVLNSALVFKFPEYAFDMIRIGTAMYGLPCGTDAALIPAMKIYATVFDVREVSSSVPLSYQSEQASGTGGRRIARIMCGYWDSPLLLTQKEIRIRIGDKLFRPADEICMDNLCIDVTGEDTVKVGDVAVLMGEDGVTINEILMRNNIHYVHSEWMCMTAGRLEKTYL
ncbi:MAG: alanine racemase [Lachnospiraceae bacterium]|nr:alanine racemase [Lachnospiraceae bacterium]